VTLAVILVCNPGGPAIKVISYFSGFQPKPVLLGANGMTTPTLAHGVASKECQRVANLKRNKSAVFLGVTELVQGPEGVIPSFVWIEPAKQRYDFRGAILADLPAFNIVIEAGKVISERKVSSFGVSLATCDSGSVASLVQHSPHIANGVKEDAGEHFRQLLREFDFVNIRSRLRILINNVGPWLTFNKVVNERIEILDVMLCAD
jgi:hypothetical protein